MGYPANTISRLYTKYTKLPKTLNYKLKAVKSQLWPNNSTIALGRTVLFSGEYIATNNRWIQQFTPCKGYGGDYNYTYSVSPALPTGINIDSRTGIVSGVSSVITSSTVYTVTVTSGASAVTSTFTLEVSAFAVRQTYTTAGVYTWTVPTGITSGKAIIWGAGGGSSTNGTLGGGGGYATGYLNLQPGTTYYIVVGTEGRSTVQNDIASLPGGPGQAGPGSSGGGTGGGFSGIFRNSVSQANAIIIAGGGGGAGPGLIGGGGGGTIGQDGSFTASQWYTSPGGKGGTQAAGGAGGSSDYINGGAGSALKGGDAVNGSPLVGGGGGGGGYFGGGAGAAGSGNRGAGGGGSGYLHPTLVTSQGQLIAGSEVTPGNSTDSQRGTAGNSQTAGKVIILFGE